VRTAHVGHPVLDALAGEPSGAAPAGARVLALLPGSRASVLDRHLPWMLACAARARLALPDLEVVLPHARHELEPQIRRHLTAAGATSWVRLETGRLHATLSQASAALSVSGTVLLDLLHHRLPAVVVYRLGGPVSAALARRLLTVPWFASVNLLAGREVLPEFGFHGTGPLEEVGLALVRALADEGWRNECRAGQDEAARRLGPPGAVQRAARYALGVVRG
jgi:lipid-A-disaccharide synthase